MLCNLLALTGQSPTACAAVLGGGLPLPKASGSATAPSRAKAATPVPSTGRDLTLGGILEGGR